MNGRYIRQIPIIGEKGQKRLQEARIGVAGCGGLGTTVVTNLASAGVGHLTIVDSDIPDESNLNRQFVYRERDTRPKANILAEWARSINPAVTVNPIVGELDETSVETVFNDCDIIVDCLDDYGTRLMLNRYAVRRRKTLVHAGVTAYHGQVTVVIPGVTPCLECIYRNLPRSKPTGPIPSIGSMVTMIASLEATQVIQTVTGTGSPFIGKMATIDLEEGYLDSFEICRDPECPVCSRMCQ